MPLTSLLMPFTDPKDPVVLLNGLTGMAKGHLRAIGSNFSVVRPNSHRASYVYREFRVINGH